jgi:hypothetical protein
MLNGLMQRNNLHMSEFSALCQAQIRVSLIEENPDTAQLWLDMWEKVDPDDEALNDYSLQIRLLELAIKTRQTPSRKSRK